LWKPTQQECAASIQIAGIQGGDEEGRMITVWIYVDTSKQVGDLDHLKVFVDEATADTWLVENDPEGMAFEYEVLE
jgi:hypothetical protein